MVATRRKAAKRKAIVPSATRARRPVGHPTYKPDEKAKASVETAVAFGITHEKIAAHIGIDTKTLRKHFRRELDEGIFKAHIKVGSVIYELATSSTDENVKFRAAAFYAARQIGWKETVTQENVGKDGGAQQMIIYSGVLSKHDETI